MRGLLLILFDSFDQDACRVRQIIFPAINNFVHFAVAFFFVATELFFTVDYNVEYIIHKYLFLAPASISKNEPSVHLQALYMLTFCAQIVVGVYMWKTCVHCARKVCYKVHMVSPQKRRKGLRATSNTRLFPETKKILNKHKDTYGGSIAGILHSLALQLEAVKK